MKNNKYGLTVTSIRKYGFKKALEVWEKYDKKCSVCGTGDRLAVHHIDHSGLSRCPNNELDNLQLICCHCHAELHLKKRWDKKQKEFGGFLRKGREKEYAKEYRIKNREKLLKQQRDYSRKRREKLSQI